MKSYVFLSNSSKPTMEEQQSTEKIKLTNVSKPCLETALSMGYNVIFGVNRSKVNELSCDLPVSFYDSHTYRSIFNFKDNYIAYKNLCEVLDKNEVDVIHCNTPVGGVVGRMCGKKYKIRKVIYTAHGFHFYKGGSIIKNFIFRHAEKKMAKNTDAIITMNAEDYENAQKFKLKENGKVFFVHGVGIDFDKIVSTKVNKDEIRKELGFKENDFLMVSAGDLVERKNYSVAIKALHECNDDKIHYLICGEGPEKNNLVKLVKKLKLEHNVHFLGFRKDVLKIMKSCDLFLFSSKQEGLPRSLMEAMACELPCIVSKIRGNTDLINDNFSGLLYDTNDIQGFANGIKKIKSDDRFRKMIVGNSFSKIKEYDVEVVKKEIETIYKEILE